MRYLFVMLFALALNTAPVSAQTVTLTVELGDTVMSKYLEYVGVNQSTKSLDFRLVVPSIHGQSSTIISISVGQTYEVVADRVGKRVHGKWIVDSQILRIEVKALSSTAGATLGVTRRVERRRS
jgi:hypothetical protein